MKRLLATRLLLTIVACTTAMVLTASMAAEKLPTDTSNRTLADARGSISGHVYEPDGVTPMRDAWIDATSVDGSTGRFAFSGHDGSYRVTDLAPGEYIVSASGERQHVHTYYDGVLSEEDATPVSVAAGQDTPGIDLVMVLGGTISGHVYEPDGVTPIANLQVEARAVDGTGYRSSRTAADGSYTFSGLAAGSYRISSDGGEQYPEVYYDGSANREDATPVTVTLGQEVSGIDLVMPASGSISGFVYEPDGVTPIADMRVDAMPMSTGSGGSTTTAADGSYVINGLIPRDYKICTMASDEYPQQYYDGVLTSSAATPVRVVANEVVPDINFVMVTGGAISGNLYQRDGTTPLSSAYVYAGRVSDNSGAHAWSAPDGSYVITGLAPGAYVVSSSGGDEDPTVYYDGATNRNEATPVEVVSGKTTANVDLVMIEGGTISGHVYQPDGATPLANVMVYSPSVLTGSGTGRLTASDGSYRISPLAPGDYWIHTTGGHEYPSMYYDSALSKDDAQPVKVEAGQVTSGIDLVVLEGGTISGHVYQPDGVTPLVDVYVEPCWRVSATSYPCGGQSVRTGTDGSYTLTGLGPFTYTVSIRPSSYPRMYYDGAPYRELATPIPVTGGAHIESIDFVVIEGGSISGHVYGLDGVTPASAVYLVAYDAASGYGVAGTSSGADGGYQMPQVPPGSFHVQARRSTTHQNAPEYYRADPSVTVPSVVNVTANENTAGIDFWLDPLHQLWLALAKR